MSSALYRLAGFLLVIGACIGAEAQGPNTANPQATAEPAHLDQVPRVPGVGSLLHGFNAGITFSGVHDSSIGWYTVATPAVSFTFSPHYSVDASVSIYPYRMVLNQTPTPLHPERLVADLGVVGDTFVGLHAGFNPGKVWTTTTAFFTIPTGNRSAGLGTGNVTFDFSDRVERYFGRAGILANIGAGNSSGLVNSLVTKDYNSLGPLAHFQAGVAGWLPGRTYVQCVGYEDLPFGSQTVYSTVGPPGFPAYTVTTGSGVGEDNGVTTYVGIPLTSHITLSGYYNRSLRQGVDTVSTGVTYVLRGSTAKKRLSLIDRALREAEGADK